MTTRREQADRWAAERTPLWCARCQTITAHQVDRATLVDVCAICHQPVEGDD